MPYVFGPFSFRTAIWYQGETNVGNAASYACTFPAMIEDWRTKLPGLGTFGFVQIAPFVTYSSNEAAGDLRHAQLSPLAVLPKASNPSGYVFRLFPEDHHRPQLTGYW